MWGNCREKHTQKSGRNRLVRLPENWAGTCCAAGPTLADLTIGRHSGKSSRAPSWGAGEWNSTDCWRRTPERLHANG